MAERSISEMTEDEILAEIEALRIRRQEASIRRIVERAAAAQGAARAVKSKGDEVGGALGAALDDILAGDDDE